MADETRRILIVDDEAAVLRMLQAELQAHGLVCMTSTDSPGALGLLGQERFDALIADVKMPQVSGLELLQNVQIHFPECKVILITGHTQPDYLADALRLGAYDYVRKPFAPGQILQVVQRALSHEAENFPLFTRAAEAMEMVGSSQPASLEAVKALVRAVEAKDPYTRRHSEQVAHYATSLARVSGVSAETLNSIYVASMLHDIGKIGVPDGVLTKPGPLTAKEFAQIRKHPIIGAEILGNIATLRHEALLVRHHHERWDGQGYPDGLAGEHIPRGSRIIHVADSMDAMLMERTYKKGYDVPRMLEELTCCAGTQFDPALALAASQWCRSNPDKLILPGRNPVHEPLCVGD